MKSVLISIQPKWCEKIASGEKTIEVRKTKQKLETPFKVYIYCTKPSKKYQTICGCMVINTDELYRLPNGKIKHDWSGELMCCNGEYTKDNFLNGKVIGEFVCDRIDEYIPFEAIEIISKYEKSIPLLKESCLTLEELGGYIGNNNADKNFYGWHITDLKIYDKPKELSEFLIDCKNCAKKYVGDENCWQGCVNGYRRLTRSPQSWCYVET